MIEAGIFGVAGDLLGAVSSLVNFFRLFLTYILVGAGVGLAGWFLHGMSRSSISGAVAAAGGAFLVVWFIGWGVVHDNTKRHLEAENTRLRAKNLELELTGEELNYLNTRLGEAALENEKKMSELKDILDKIPPEEECDCSLPEDVRDAINSIR